MIEEKALLRTWPGAMWSLKADDKSYKGLTWHSTDIDKPTKAEFDAAVADYVSNQSVYDYKEKRQSEYPAIGDQLDAILKYLSSQQNLSIELQQIIDAWNAVKIKYPKS